MKRGLLRQAPRFVACGQTRQSAQALRLYASSAPSPKVDEIQFEIVTPLEGAEYTSRPFPALSKAQLEEGVKAKTNQVRNQWEAKFVDTPEGALFKDVLQFKPYDEKALKEELAAVTQPRIQATVDEAYNTKNHTFLTNYLASRTASYLEDPTLFFSYGENPSASLSQNWAATLKNNLATLTRLDLLNKLTDIAKDFKELQELEAQTKKTHQDTVKQLRADMEFLSNKQAVADSFAKEAGLTPANVSDLTDLAATNPLAALTLPVVEKHMAQWEQFNKESPVSNELNDVTRVLRDLVAQLQASGLKFDSTKVSF